MNAWVAATKDQVSGKILLVGKQTVIPVSFDAPQKRRPDDLVKAQYDPEHGDGGRGGFGGLGRGGPQDPNRLTAAQVSDRIDTMLLELFQARKDQLPHPVRSEALPSSLWLRGLPKRTSSESDPHSTPGDRSLRLVSHPSRREGTDSSAVCPRRHGSTPDA
jgi:hypothetical protein